MRMPLLLTYARAELDEVAMSGKDSGVAGNCSGWVHTTAIFLFYCRPGVSATYFCSHSSFHTLWQQSTLLFLSGLVLRSTNLRHSSRAFHLVAAWFAHARCQLLMCAGVASCHATRIKQSVYPLQSRYYLLCNCTRRWLTRSPRLSIDSSDAATLAPRPLALLLPRRLSQLRWMR